MSDTHQERHHADNGARREEILRLLHEAQSSGNDRNFVTTEALAEIARKLDIPLAEAEGVTSFYRSFSREPRGRHVIRVCDSLSCRIKGSLDVYHYLRKRLGIRRNETTADGMFTLEIVNCLGSCDTAANMMIDDELYTRLDAEGIESILDSVEKGGES